MPISRRDLIKRFKALGFSGPYSGGRHQFMSKGKLKIRVPNPHESHDISDSLLREILRQTGITKEQWDKT
jgi:predicted RNA binding protein YcfA (HicA-like mRNA interferase family)